MVVEHGMVNIPVVTFFRAFFYEKGKSENEVTNFSWGSRAQHAKGLLTIREEVRAFVVCFFFLVSMYYNYDRKINIFTASNLCGYASRIWSRS